jgi:molecular chaperone DnaJ
MTTTKRDYYEILGVGAEADEDEIRRAYRALAREYHPDVSTEPEAEERWRELVEAYSTLSKPERRLLYDRFGFRGRGFGDELAAAAAAAEEPEPAARPDVVAELELGYYEARRGTTRKIRIEGEALCGRCGGEGGTTETCSACDGTGSVRSVSEREVGRLLQVETCETCAGAGVVFVDECSRCGGNGRVPASRTVRVRIPGGVEDGQTVRVRGEGNPSPDGERGDAFVVLRVAEAPAGRPVVKYLAALLFLAALALLAFLLLHH